MRHEKHQAAEAADIVGLIHKTVQIQSIMVGQVLVLHQLLHMRHREENIGSWLVRKDAYI